MAVSADRELELALVADIGGTHARFALAPLRAGGELIAPASLEVAEHSTIAKAIASYLEQTRPAAQPRAAMLAIAAPADEDEIRLTNSRWAFSQSALRTELGLEALHAINDFAANAWALPALGPGRLRAIGPVLPSQAAGARTLAVLGPGTGLGVGAVRQEPDGRIAVLETEGGHVDFAPVDECEDAILDKLRARFGRVSAERLLCGPGLANLHWALTGDELTPEQVSAKAPGTVATFCRLLGGFAGNAALMYGAWDGVYLAGSMLRAMAGELAKAGFRERFEAKGRFSARLAAVPTFLVEEPWLGLIGAAAALRARLALT